MVVAQINPSGPNSRRFHGPSRASAETAAVKSATEATTLTKGAEKRHHGSKLARNVDTGTAAAMMATRPVTRNSRQRWAGRPQPRLQSRPTVRKNASWSRTKP